MKRILLIILIAVINIGTTFSKEINWETELKISTLKKCENKEFRDNCIDLEKFPDGTTYYGEFSNNIREGYGIAIFNDESRYEGIFKNGWRFSGTQKYKNGGTYTGSFKNGAIHGYGKYLFPDGTLYEGEFQNGNYSGKATIKYASGDIYIGDLKDLKFDGEGEYSSKNGQIYRGQYKDGKHHGTGRLQYVNGDIYEGGFENGSYSGYGILKFKYGEIYIGDFENGSASGFGEYKFQDKTKYIGGFKKGRFSGRGIEIFGEQIISRQGIWDDGELIKAEAFDINQLSINLNIKSLFEIENLNLKVRDAFRSLRTNKDFVSAENYITLMYDPKKSFSNTEIKIRNEVIYQLNNIKKFLPNDNAKEIKIILIDDKINDIQRMSIEELNSKSKHLTNNYPPGHYFYALGEYYEFLYLTWTSPSKISDYAKFFLNENNIRAIAFSDYEDSSENQCKYRTIAFTSYFTMSGLEKNFDQRQKIAKRAKYALDFLNPCLDSNQKNKIAFLYSIEQYTNNILSIEERLKINSLQDNLSEQSNEEIISLKKRRGHILRSALKFDQAKIEFTEAIEIAKNNHIYGWLSDLELDLSILLIDQEKYNEAQEIIIKNLAQANVNGSSNWYKCHILQLLARSYQHQKNFENSITLLKSCIDIVDSERKEMITTSQISDKAFYANGFYGSFYENLARLLIDSDRISEAHLVLDMLKEEEQFEFIRRSNDADTRKSRIGYTSTEQTWVTRYRQIADKLAALGVEEQALQKSAKLGLTNEEKQRQQDLQKDLAVARKAFDTFLLELQDSLAKQGPARSVEVLETSQNALRETQALLKELGNDTVLLQYFVTDDKVGILLTTSGVQLARTTAIKSQELNRQIFEFRRSLRDPKANTLPAAKALYQLLLSPVEQDLVQARAKNIMLSLDGALRYIPFAALHDGKQHLVQRWNMPMYTSVTKNKLRDAVTPQWQAAGLGLTRAVGNFSALPAVKGEMSSIVKTGVTGVLPGEVYLDEAFNAARFKDVSRRKFQLLHVASHFQFSPGTEINSFLLLGDGQQLSLGDIRTQNYRFDNVDLITLSACDTGLGGGRDAQGREIEGFGVIAQQQGAKAVLATLWPVADQSTATLMADMYKQRQDKGLTKIEALRQAQISLLAQPKYAHPFYWAPFILMGNWK